jgi:hypothetical protein
MSIVVFETLARKRWDTRPVDSLLSGRDRSNCTAQRPLVVQNPCNTCLCVLNSLIRGHPNVL